jgi:hypothetical protein
LGVGGEVVFSSCIWCREWTAHVHLDSELCMQVLLGGGRGGFVFVSANGKTQGALLSFLLSLGHKKESFYIFPCFSMCSL